MKKPTFNEKTIHGQAVTGRTIEGFKKSAESLNDTITVWANYGAFCSVFHNGHDVLNNMLALPAFKLASGKPSALGKKVIEYVLAHTGQFLVLQDGGKFAQKVFKGKEAKANKEAARGFVNPATGEFTARLDGDSIPDNVDFSLTFAQFAEFVKPKADKPTDKSVKASTLVGQFAKLSENFKSGKVIGTVEEAESLVGELIEVLQQSLALAAELRASVESVDPDKATELLKSGQSGQSTRAGGKVESAA